MKELFIHRGSVASSMRDSILQFMVSGTSSTLYRRALLTPSSAVDGATSRSMQPLRVMTCGVSLTSHDFGQVDFRACKVGWTASVSG